VDEARGYFEFLANMGLTKHLGSMEATRRLIDVCHIQGGELVLDVGCGVGATPLHLVRTAGCRVVAVDLLEAMVRQARQRARRETVEKAIRFAAADARRLPFADGAFDVVLMESLNVFFEEKLQAVKEYTRVTRTGGYVGMTEMTWLDAPAPATADYYRRTVYADALQAEGWQRLLEEAGLEDVVGHAEPVSIPKEGRGRIQRYGCSGYLSVLVRMVRLILRDPSSRAFLANVTGSMPRDMLGDVGFGVYAGRKPGPRSRGSQGN
jgi:SAM-dependent methyltransferase